MTYKVTITWSPTTAQSAIEQLAETIGGRFDLEKSYVQKDVFKDTPYYSEAPDGTLGDTPVSDNENTMHKGVLLAFKQAIENDEHSILLTGISAKDALYFEELGYPMGEQGFTIEVEQESGGEHPVEVDEISFKIFDSYEDYGDENIGWFAVEISPGETYHFIKISEDYVTRKDGSVLLDAVLSDSSGTVLDSSIIDPECKPINDENTLFMLSDQGVVPMFIITVPGGTSWTEGGVNVDFPSGGSWTYFEILSEFSAEGVASVSYTKVVETLKSISAQIQKTGYFVGQTLDLRELSVSATYTHIDDGQEVSVIYPLSSDEYTTIPEDGYTFTETGNIDLVVSYKDKTASIELGACATTNDTTITWDGVPKDGFTLTTERPADWGTSWYMYYESDGSGGYKPAEPLSWQAGDAPPTWKENTYYDAKGVKWGAGDELSAEKFYLVLDGLVPDPWNFAASVDAVFNDLDYYALLRPPYAPLSGDYYYYWKDTNGMDFAVCVKRAGCTVTIGQKSAVFDKAGTYFLQKRANTSLKFEFVQSLIFNK